MISISAYIDTRRETKRGYPVKIRVYDNKSKSYKLYPTGEYQSTKVLKITSGVTRVLRKYQERANFCNENELYGDEAQTVIESGFTKPVDEEIAVLEAKLRRLKRSRYVDFRDFTKQIIEEKSAQGMSIQAYLDVIREIDNYVADEAFGINDITYEWLIGYITYKKRLGTNDGGLSYYLRTMRTIYKDAQRRESLGVKTDNPFTGLIRTAVSSKTKSLKWSVEDFKKLLDFRHPSATKLNQANMYRVRDLFLFQFAIGGQDFVELANLKWSNIKKGRVVFQRHKNRNKPHGGEWVDNYLHPYALEVLEKHGDKESDRIFSFIALPESEKYRNQNRYTGKTLERISKALSIQPKLMTKTPRYAFRTFAGDLLISDLVIETIQGHKPKSITHKYQKGISPNVLDKEHRKVLDLVFG